jgi:hypothetical protein
VVKAIPEFAGYWVINDIGVFTGSGEPRQSSAGGSLGAFI